MKRILSALLLLWLGCASATAPYLTTGSTILQGPLATGSVTALQITTASLPSDAIGSSYSQALTIVGGTAPYKCSVVSAIPNTGFWHNVTPGCTVFGTPTDLDETEAITYQVTDATGATATKALSVGVTVSGSLSIVSASTATVASGGILQWKFVGAGGTPWYYWSAYDAIQSNNQCSLSWDGWLRCAPTSTGTFTIHAQVTDSEGDTPVTQTLTVTVNSALQLSGVDSVDNLIHLPAANAGSLYRAYLNSWGGTHTSVAYSCISACPGWMNITGNVISGTPTVSGNVEPVIKVTDSANSASNTALINVSSSGVVTKPSYTPFGVFFVKNGLIYDSGGNPFLPIGTNQAHYDSVSYTGTQANAALAEANIDRIFIYNDSASAIASFATTRLLPVDVVPLITQSYFPSNGTYSCGGEATTGRSDIACFASGAQYWVSGYSSFTSLQANSMFNIANEWGASGATWAAAYTYVAAPIASVSGSTITITSSAGTNPFAATPIVYAVGCSTTQVSVVSSTGGSSGAWTITTAQTISGCSSATLYGGAVGIMRAIGYTAPLVIDAPNSGQDPNSIITYAAAIQASDPEQNLIFSLHMYNQFDSNRQHISGISVNANATISLSSNQPFNPYSPAYPTLSSNAFASIPNLIVSGVTGTMSALNGVQMTTDNRVGGTVAGTWQVLTTYSTTGLTYGGGGVVTDANNYAYVLGELAALRASNVATFIGEFPISGNDAGGPFVAWNGSTNSGGTQLTVTSMLTGSAPILSGMAITNTVSGYCGNLSFGAQVSGTTGGAGVYNISYSGCSSVSGVFYYPGWGDTQTNMLASQVMAAAYSNQIGVIPWAWDDHRNGDGSADFASQYVFAPVGNTSSACYNSGSMTWSVGCYVVPSDGSESLQDFMFNPRYGSLSQAQKAPVLH